MPASLSSSHWQAVAHALISAVPAARTVFVCSHRRWVYPRFASWPSIVQQADRWALFKWLSCASCVQSGVFIVVAPLIWMVSAARWMRPCMPALPELLKANLLCSHSMSNAAKLCASSFSKVRSNSKRKTWSTCLTLPRRKFKLR